MYDVILSEFMAMGLAVRRLPGVRATKQNILNLVNGAVCFSDNLYIGNGSVKTRKYS